MIRVYIIAVSKKVTMRPARANHSRKALDLRPKVKTGIENAMGMRKTSKGRMD